MQTSFLFKSLEYLQKFSGKSFFFSPSFFVLSSHIELQICIKAKFELGSCIAAGCRGVFSNEKKSILKMQKLGRGGQRTAEICSN